MADNKKDKKENIDTKKESKPNECKKATKDILINETNTADILQKNITNKYSMLILEDDFPLSNRISNILGSNIYNYDNNIINFKDRDNYMVNFKSTFKDADYLLKAGQLFEENTASLKKERLDLLDKLRQAELEVTSHKKDKEKLESAKKKADESFQKLEKVNKDIQKQLTLGNLIAQVNDQARKKLFESEDFRKLFENISECMAYVVSIDIRRSTELMLKAKHPRLFEKFIVSLCRGLSEIIMNNYGIFDKFTGDGILSFFPDFFSGKDAGLMAVKSSIECHKFFKNHYAANRNCFVSVMQDVGLGIGLDYGNAHLVRMGGSYTVVGNPVVYSCRMSGGNAGDTLLNQVAYEEIFKDYKQFLNIEETSINIKHEGNFLCYKVSSNGEPMDFKKPDWDNLIAEYSADCVVDT